ncbi:MAG: 2-phospho-L-lactate transferase [Methanotrichaceae archaeon]|nr:2-phospho-L-lactate transferase [Methanotrichaceae archaeon]
MLVLSGGTGTPKLLWGLKEMISPEDLSVVVNTAEDLWLSGNYVCPDIDSVIYTLADMIDTKRWWGIKGDRTLTHDFLLMLGVEEKLALGEKDRAVHIFRSDLLRQGVKLSLATEALTKGLGLGQKVVPMTDDSVSTFVSTSEGVMHFQDFWVARRGRPEVKSVKIRGIEKALPSQGFLDLLEKEDTVIIGPSNPVSSIGPILSLPGVRERLEDKRVIAISPFVGDKPVSGPAPKFMAASGVSADDRGVASLLGKVDTLVVDKNSSYGGNCVRMSTLMRTKRDSLKLAESLLKLVDGV